MLSGVVSGFISVFVMVFISVVVVSVVDCGGSLLVVMFWFSICWYRVV